MDYMPLFPTNNQYVPQASPRCTIHGVPATYLCDHEAEELEALVLAFALWPRTAFSLPEPQKYVRYRPFGLFVRGLWAIIIMLPTFGVQVGAMIFRSMILRHVVYHLEDSYNPGKTGPLLSLLASFGTTESSPWKF